MIADIQPWQPTLTYDEFIASKRRNSPDAGFNVTASDMPDWLFPFQRQIAAWALRRGRALVAIDTGLGKGPIALVWCNEVVKRAGGDVLLVAPLAVSQQFQRESDKFGIPITLCRTAADIRPGINVTNYERLHHFDPGQFVGIALDECFAAGTLVDTPQGPVPIETIRPGDLILNAAGVDRVLDISRKEVRYAVRTTINSRCVISSPDHPYFTRRGWVAAKDLAEGERVVPTTTAMRMVRGDIHRRKAATRQQAVLRSILLSEMANASTGAYRQGSQSRGCAQAWSETARVACIGNSGIFVRNRTHSKSQPVDQTRRSGENFRTSQVDGVVAVDQRREWSRIDTAAIAVTQSAGRTMAIGVRGADQPSSDWLPDALQTRFGESDNQGRDRSRRIIARRQAQSLGSEKRRDVDFARVDRIEVLELGHPDLDRCRDASGKLYFYDIGATRHPSFSVNGLLVHNCSILKGFQNKIRKRLTDFVKSIPYRLCSTATPSPNEHMELINYADYLDIMTGKEIIALYFTQDGNTTQKFRLKRHAEPEWWKWLATWMVACRQPGDIGFPGDDERYQLPPRREHEIIVTPEYNLGDLPPTANGMVPMFVQEAQTLTEQRWVKRATIGDRVKVVAEMVNASDEPWIVWCHLNAESAALAKAIPDAVEVSGSDDPDVKESRLVGFSTGKHRVLVTKPEIAGFGLNWQHCRNVAFVGLNHSFEQFYQAVRRCWRFGQERDVNVYIVSADAEGAVLTNLRRKERENNQLMTRLVAAMAEHQELAGASTRDEMEYREDVAEGPGWTLHLGDNVRLAPGLADESVGLALTSVPFPSMYAYTNSPHDMGNVNGVTQMVDQFKYLAIALLPKLMPGRTFAIHLTQLTAMVSREGYMGMRDFRGPMIIAMQECGYHWVDEITIGKNPQLQATRNKEHQLLFKTLAQNAGMLRSAIADYMLFFRKAGVDPAPIRAGISKKYNSRGGWITEQEWIDWASPIWPAHSREFPRGIRETNVLNVRQARDANDERHLCPLQLDVIERVIKLKTNPGELVLDPFAGISSTGHVALKLGRRYVGFELKESYWRSGINVLTDAAAAAHQPTLFDHIDEPDEEIAS